MKRGERELCDIQPTDVLTIVRRLEARGTFELAHVEGNSVRAAYNYAEHLPERRKMMQWWGDYLDRLRALKPLSHQRRIPGYISP